MRRILVIVGVLALAVLTACDTIQPTGDSASDAESAQNQLPTLSQYTSTDADSVKDALTRALQVGSLGSGNLIAAGLIERLNNTADCLGNVGAIAGRVYTGLTPPVVGVLAVVNNERLTNNFLQCAVNPGMESQSLSRQALQPCAKSGSYTDNGISYSYIYAASDISMCNAFDQWLATKG
ncbi:MAG: hypothetical protein IT298_10525 [Chloroflexi bacterium]|nr:MAG: hypothetical protein UZ13_01664 [Chloroflexi bacterium OLB13]MBV6435350.1 hypothetical protein [Anaerolineae bacterium]MCC6566187.1 hypothetical protein [Chloroflexota bacterium]MDL1917123.1 hypothetical protein [Anaerolineae bacterium CFX4]MBW7880562.1 hypothetical protein [Anaerolineae bacterium]